MPLARTLASGAEETRTGTSITPVLVHRSRRGQLLAPQRNGGRTNGTAEYESQDRLGMGQKAQAGLCMEDNPGARAWVHNPMKYASLTRLSLDFIHCFLPESQSQTRDAVVGTVPDRDSCPSSSLRYPALAAPNRPSDPVAVVRLSIRGKRAAQGCPSVALDVMCYPRVTRNARLSLINRGSSLLGSR